MHIADVSHYVKEGSALDEAAYERGTSVYFTERAVHMFPAELATGLCSLNPNVDRLVQSCLMEVDRRGNVVRYEIHDGVINSDARMTYTAVNAILTERDQQVIEQYRLLVPMFELMRDLFEILNQRRRRRGSIDFDLPEAEVDSLGVRRRSRPSCPASETSHTGSSKSSCCLPTRRWRRTSSSTTCRRCIAYTSRRTSRR